MNLQEIERLLEKYFEGESTLSEEEQLRKFFASGNVPERWNDLARYFTYFDQEKDLSMMDPSFDESIMEKVKESKLGAIMDIHRPWIYWISGIAATILILLAIFVKFDPISKRVEDTYKDPQLAYNEAKKILLFVSAKFNQGTKNLGSIQALETGLTELKPVGAYNKVANEVKRLNEVERVEKMIINN